MRVYVIGGGHRALALARTLVAEQHAVRFVTRDEAHRAAIEQTGSECWIGDPDRIGTLRNGLENVTVMMWLLGTASGDPENVAAIHGSRLKMMLEKVTDTTVRGVVYENAGSVGDDVLAAGLAEVRFAHRTNEIPYALLDADPRGDVDAWVAAARACIESLTQAQRRTEAA